MRRRINGPRTRGSLMRSCFLSRNGPRWGWGWFEALICAKVQDALVRVKESCAEDESMGKAFYYPNCYVVYAVFG